LHSTLEAVGSRLRAGWRLARALSHLVYGLLVILLRFPKLSTEQKQLRVQIWSRQMLVCIGIRLQLAGRPHMAGPLLLVANHVSWLDITALHAARFCRFVSKADVRAWPLIGDLAAGIGTLFIQRESRKDALRVVYHMDQSLRNGDVLAIFPEGTTGDGVSLLPFHANLLQAAISSDAPVQPVAIDYLDSGSGHRSAAPCYVGDMSLLESVWRCLKEKSITVKICFGAIQSADGRSRRVWAADLRSQIEQMRKQP
jgi:1-acyl-sn-glycerol-3-phosphate acyltransferase